MFLALRASCFTLRCTVAEHGLKRWQLTLEQPVSTEEVGVKSWNDGDGGCVVVTAQGYSAVMPLCRKSVVAATVGLSEALVLAMGGQPRVLRKKIAKETDVSLVMKQFALGGFKGVAQCGCTIAGKVCADCVDASQLFDVEIHNLERVTERASEKAWLPHIQRGLFLSCAARRGSGGA
jgi:hypothetical protein